MYPDSVIRRAMQLVVLVMCRRKPYEQLVEALAQEEDIEIRLFLRQLCSLSLPEK